MTPWITVLGLGENGPDAEGYELARSSELIVGGDRHLEMFGDIPGEKLRWRRPLADTIADIGARRGRPTLVLATGDPMWFGIGAVLSRTFPAGEMRILPTAGAFSLAAARMAWPIEQVRTLTLHGRPVDLLALHVVPAARLLILSHDRTTPGTVARWLTERHYGDSRLTALSRMGGPAEGRMCATARDWKGEPSDLNTLAVECRPGPGAVAAPLVPGLPDSLFEHDGMITKSHVRAATLALLAPAPGARLWDIGAGSGAVSIEWMRAHGAATAIEPDVRRGGALRRNASALGVPGIDLVPAHAPEALEGLPAPDAVFIGGGLTRADMTDRTWKALVPGGRIVANAVTVEGEAVLMAARERLGGTLHRISVESLEPIGRFHGFRPALPVMQWAATKPW